MEYPKFKVCCRCFTFNQSKYITDAMNGFTMQQTSFPFVCTIVDDASTDGEQEVIRKYVEENFDLSEGSVAYHKETDYAYITYAQHKTNKNCYFAILYLKENHYSQRKPKMQYLEEWRGMCEYEALCEGDDYWVDKYKITKQLEILDKFPYVSFVYGKAVCYLHYKEKFCGTLGKAVNGVEGRLISSSMPTLTTCCRVVKVNQYTAESKQWVHDTWLMGDYPMWIWMEINGGGIFLNETFGVYRITKDSASHGSYEFRKKFIKNACEISVFFANKYNYDTEKIFEAFNIQLFSNAIQHRNIFDMNYFFDKIKHPDIRIKTKHILGNNPMLRHLLFWYCSRNM